MNTLLTEVIVLTTIGWLATLYAWRQKWQRQQHAWQWWQQQQATQSHHTAESIRDGLLQQTFAFRRYLETIDIADSEAIAAPQTKAQTHSWLNRFQSFYQSLEELSDELSPPFVADSLPHALQFTLKSWQTAQKLPFHSELPQQWNHNQSTPQQNQAVLAIVNALLTLLLPLEHNATHVSITLGQQEQLNSLIVKIDYSKLSTAQEQPELTYLKEIFHSLTTGQLAITHETLSITSQLSWQNIYPVN